MRKEDLFSVNNLPNKKKIHIALDPRHLRTYTQSGREGGWPLGVLGVDSTDPLLYQVP